MNQQSNTSNNTLLCGIDYGAKRAGTTVIATYDKVAQKYELYAVEKGKDADDFVLTQLRQLKVGLVFFDAPLSLPGVYQNSTKYNDYFYRQADRLLKGMSPMFIGGLTARAMRLKAVLQKEGINLIETYPAVHARRWGLKELGYKGKKGNIETVVDQINAHFPTVLPKERIISWHHLDALLALYSAWRYEQSQAEVFGTKEEGCIIV